MTQAKQPSAKVITNNEVVAEVNGGELALGIFAMQAQKIMTAEQPQAFVEIRVELEDGVHYTRLIREQGVYPIGKEPETGLGATLSDIVRQNDTVKAVSDAGGVIADAIGLLQALQKQKKYARTGKTLDALVDVHQTVLKAQAALKGAR